MTEGDEPSHRFLPRIRQELDKLPLNEAQKEALIPYFLEKAFFLETKGDQSAYVNLQPDSAVFDFSGKLQAVVQHFQKDGLTSDDYLAVALRQPQLMVMNVDTVIGNIADVVGRFKADGLTTRDYLKAGLKQPSLFIQAPSTLAGNITGVVEHFATHGLTTREYLKAALNKPSLFTMSAATVASHIDGVVERFAPDGLNMRDCVLPAGV